MNVSHSLRNQKLDPPPPAKKNSKREKSSRACHVASKIVQLTIIFVSSTLFPRNPTHTPSNTSPSECHNQSNPTQLLTPPWAVAPPSHRSPTPTLPGKTRMTKMPSPTTPNHRHRHSLLSPPETTRSPAKSPGSSHFIAPAQAQARRTSSRARARRRGGSSGGRSRRRRRRST